MYRSLTLLCLLATAASIHGYRWNCEVISDSSSEFVDWCVVSNLSDTDLKEINSSNEYDSIKLALIEYQSSSIAPWMKDYFLGVDHLAFIYGNIRSFYVAASLRHLTISVSNVTELILNPTEDYQLETIMVLESFFSFPQNMSALKSLKSVGFRNGIYPVVNLSMFDGLINLSSITFRESETSSVVIPSGIDLPNLVSLNISFNHIRSVPENVNQLVGLEDLNLYWNRIEHLNMDDFNGLNNLRRLTLDMNSLKTINSIATINLPNLREITIFSSKLQELDVQHWNMPKLKFINLAHSKLTEIRNFKEHLPKRMLLEGSGTWSCKFVEDAKQDIQFLESVWWKKCETSVGGVCCVE